MKAMQILSASINFQFLQPRDPLLIQVTDGPPAVVAEARSVCAAADDAVSAESTRA